MRVLSWNLFQGRARTPAGRPLLGEFCRTLDTFAWDVALLQEVPSWWPEPLATACAAQQRHVRTARNWVPPVQRAVGARAPDLIKSGGGGCNAVLVRGGRRIVDHRTRRLRWWPERRFAHGVELAGAGWVVNVHAQVRPHARSREDTARAVGAGRAWAGTGPLVIGGDLNVRDPWIEGFLHAAHRSVDHIYATGGWAVAVPGETLDAGGLSDHRPIAVTLRAGDANGVGETTGAGPVRSGR
jgi:endonuclease/exonuclease/phosphatase family metal-dependent hydrolase